MSAMLWGLSYFDSLPSPVRCWARHWQDVARHECAVKEDEKSHFIHIAYYSVHLRTLFIETLEISRNQFRSLQPLRLTTLDFLLRTAVECLSRHRFWDREILKRQWRRQKLSQRVRHSIFMHFWHCFNLMSFNLWSTCPLGGEGVTHIGRLPLDCQHGQGKTILQADLEVCSGNHPEMKRSDILMTIGCQVALWSRGPCRSYSQLPRCRPFGGPWPVFVSKANFILVHRIASNYLLGKQWAVQSRNSSDIISSDTFGDWRTTLVTKILKKYEHLSIRQIRAGQHWFDVLNPA